MFNHENEYMNHEMHELTSTDYRIKGPSPRCGDKNPIIPESVDLKIWPPCGQYPCPSVPSVVKSSSTVFHIIFLIIFLPFDFRFARRPLVPAAGCSISSTWCLYVMVPLRGNLTKSIQNPKIPESVDIKPSWPPRGQYSWKIRGNSCKKQHIIAM